MVAGLPYICRCITMMVLISGTLVLRTDAVQAHPFHVSCTEMEWNERTQCFEVAMNLPLAGLEDAVSLSLASTGASITWERVGGVPDTVSAAIPRRRHSAGEFERTSAAACRYRFESAPDSPALHRYIQRHFTISIRDGKPFALRWVGAEREVHTVWLYFELTPETTEAAFNGTPAGKPSNEQHPENSRGGRTADRNTSLTWDDLFSPSTTEMPKSGKSVRSDVAPVSPGGGADSYAITNTVLFETEPATVHQMTIGVQGNVYSAQTTTDCATAHLPFAEAQGRSVATCGDFRKNPEK